MKLALVILALISNAVLGAKKRNSKKVMTYHELKDLRETMITKNDRSPELFNFYKNQATNYKKWTQDKPEHLQRRPKTGDEVWFFNEEELWWQTGVAGNVSKGSVENGVWLAQVSPTQWPKDGGFTNKYMRVLYPDKRRISWQSQKACDLGTLQKEYKDPIMGKRMFNIAKSIKEDSQYAHVGLARWFIARKQWESAYEMCENALKAEKRWFLPYMYMGIIKRRQGQADGEKNPTEHFKTALRHFKEAMELNPSNIEAINNLAHFYYYIDKNHRKSCFWHRVLNSFDEDAISRIKHLSEHIAECDRVQPRFDHEEL